MNDRFKSKIDLQNYCMPDCPRISTLPLGHYISVWRKPDSRGNYFDPGKGPKAPIRSIRQSSHGFGNPFAGDYTNVQRYVNRIEKGVADGKLISDYEFHGAVRFKGNSNLS